PRGQRDGARSRRPTADRSDRDDARARDRDRRRPIAEKAGAAEGRRRSERRPSTQSHPGRTAMSYDPTSTEGLTQHGRERLEQMRGGGFFTSDLSVNEFLLVKQAGFDPLGLVIGSSIYHIGYQQSSWKQSMEMDVLSQAM